MSEPRDEKLIVTVPVLEDGCIVSRHITNRFASINIKKYMFDAINKRVYLGDGNNYIQDVETYDQALYKIAKLRTKGQSTEMSEEQKNKCPYCGGEAIEDIIILINGKPATRCARGCVINGRLYFTIAEWNALPRDEQNKLSDMLPCPKCGGQCAYGAYFDGEVYGTKERPDNDDCLKYMCIQGCAQKNNKICFSASEWLALDRSKKPTKLDELANEQGVEPITDISKIVGVLPDDYCPDCGGKTTFRSDETIANECQCSKELSIVDEAINLINGDRQHQYGDPATAATEIAAAWSAMLGINIKPPMYRIMAAAEKIIREDHQRKADNRIDALGELFLAARMIQKGE